VSSIVRGSTLTQPPWNYVIVYVLRGPSTWCANHRNLRDGPTGALLRTWSWSFRAAAYSQEVARRS